MQPISQQGEQAEVGRWVRYQRLDATKPKITQHHSLALTMKSAWLLHSPANCSASVMIESARSSCLHAVSAIGILELSVRKKRAQSEEACTVLSTQSGPWQEHLFDAP